jgi:hypothetical protein
MGTGPTAGPVRAAANDLVREVPMPNVTWLEPQVLVDLLAMNLYAAENDLALPGPAELAVVSPWLSDVEIDLRPGPWHQQLGVGRAEKTTLSACLHAFRGLGWKVEVAVLAYGTGSSGLSKTEDSFSAEVRMLRSLYPSGVLLYQVPNLHAKGVVTPLGVITGSTNLPHSGLYAQVQNAIYFPYDHPDHAANRAQLLNCFRSTAPKPPP